MEQESRIAFNTAAKYTNRVSVVGKPGNLVRIAFAEIAPGEDKSFYFHSAVMMSLSDASALRDALDTMIKKLNATG